MPPPKVKTSGKILVIDDEEMILSVFGSMLNTLGYECALVQEGIEGSRQYMRARADGHPFAAVLLGWDGSERPGGEEIFKLLLQADPAAPGDSVQWIRRERSLQGSRATWIQSISRETVQHVGICLRLE